MPVCSFVCPSDVARLVFVLSAAAKHAPIRSLLLAYVVKHYRYLRSTSPHMVTQIQVLLPPSRSR
jgi:hypothetical protein